MEHGSERVALAQVVYQVRRRVSSGAICAGGALDTRVFGAAGLGSVEVLIGSTKNTFPPGFIHNRCADICGIKISSIPALIACVLAFFVSPHFAVDGGR